MSAIHKNTRTHTHILIHQNEIKHEYNVKNVGDAVNCSRALAKKKKTSRSSYPRPLLLFLVTVWIIQSC
jgi:hypothetical protein